MTRSNRLLEATEEAINFTGHAKAAGVAWEEVDTRKRCGMSLHPGGQKK
jgi:hypothetical protein